MGTWGLWFLKGTAQSSSRKLWDGTPSSKWHCLHFSDFPLPTRCSNTLEGPANETLASALKTKQTWPPDGHSLGGGLSSTEKAALTSLLQAWEHRYLEPGGEGLLTASISILTVSGSARKSRDHPSPLFQQSGPYSASRQNHTLSPAEHTTSRDRKSSEIRAARVVAGH